MYPAAGHSTRDNAAPIEENHGMITFSYDSGDALLDKVELQLFLLVGKVYVHAR